MSAIIEWPNLSALADPALYCVPGITPARQKHAVDQGNIRRRRSLCRFPVRAALFQIQQRQLGRKRYLHTDRCFDGFGGSRVCDLEERGLAQLSNSPSPPALPATKSNSSISVQMLLRRPARCWPNIAFVGKMVLPDRIELSTSPLPMECSTTELRQHCPVFQRIGPKGLCRRPVLATRAPLVQARGGPRRALKRAKIRVAVAQLLQTGRLRPDLVPF